MLRVSLSVLRREAGAQEVDVGPRSGGALRPDRTPGTLRAMAERTLLQRIHNPKNYECGCDSDCWCNRTFIGWLVKWWFPARWFGIRHKSSFFDGMSWRDIRGWKRQQERKGLYPMIAQPRYEKIARDGERGWALLVRRADGTILRHRIGRFASPS
jgi:hypothetical protein